MINEHLNRLLFSFFTIHVFFHCGLFFSFLLQASGRYGKWEISAIRRDRERRMGGYVGVLFLSDWYEWKYFFEKIHCV